MEVVENGDLSIWWAEVILNNGVDGAEGEVNVDLWACCEMHHWHAPFIFISRTTDIILRYEPTEFMGLPRKSPRFHQGFTKVG